MRKSGGCALSSPTASTSGLTILDLAGLPQPTYVDGIAQEPMHGVGFLHTIAGPEAEERHTQQYFETAPFRFSGYAGAVS